jgi:hypothetical protein
MAGALVRAVGEYVAPLLSCEVSAGDLARVFEQPVHFRTPMPPAVIVTIVRPPSLVPTNTGASG